MENGYKADNSFLTDISESTCTENGYKTNIITNPHATGIYNTENGYKLDLTINPYPIGGALTENNYKLDLIPEKTFPDPSDIAVTKITISKTIVGQGYSIQINITLANQEFTFETFHVTLSANNTAIKTQTVTLTSKSSATLSFPWNTTGFAKGNHTISAYAEPVSGETDTADNNSTDGWVVVAIVGDVNADGKVEGKDLGWVAWCFGSYPGAPPPMTWDPNCDINNDGKVDGKDLGIVAEHFGEPHP